MNADRELLRLRAEMDDINHRLAELLHQRARLCRAIGRCKRPMGLPVFDAEREAEMLAGLKTPAPGDGFSRDALHRIFRQVLAESRPIVKAD